MSINVPIKVPVQVPIKVMYFGMAIDIVGPMQLVPDFDTIYTINIVDKCAGFGGSIKNIIKMIKMILETGKNIYALPECTEFDLTPPTDPYSIIIDMIAPSIILNEVFYAQDGVIDYNKVCELSDDVSRCKIKWHLTFNYNGKERNLIYYFNSRFDNEWDPEITNIGHFLFQGSYDFHYLSENDDGERDDIVIDMIETRSCLPATIYALEYFNIAMPFKKTIKQCSPELEYCVEKIAYITYDEFEKGWENETYDDY